MSLLTHLPLQQGTAPTKQTSANDLRYYDLEEGSGGVIKAGDKIVVHYDCLYRGLDVVSSRSARLLGGNRTIAEPYEFTVGDPVYAASIASYTETANGMFSGSSGPKPPQALSLSVVGMKKGGKRTVIVDNPKLGFPNGVGEIPANTTFELKVEVLNVLSVSKA
ncbi:Peptidyl-prolyl cis-trans isomerase FKBP18, chloroplastic [Tetrabaena socialis]|uniref:peptidylprolyl isomerase n=1 Tax=Tetrabaena socialis TaxID=47790 RepID=A0A2J8ACE5_9CHLO|nr:Peptidyl-prolyl cis-trans isomerase FKBP18, chloroplastic [Tetrabaena socialis]|eukprot:PNH10177.1 Peptidyl-prolyl cis-trans isomerase FKBP18, chloroplastic [Tetrabaena socialis]